MLDHVNIISWSILYLLIVILGAKNWTDRKSYMPHLPGSLNLGWELNALALTKGDMYGHVLWAGLNLLIYMLNVHCLTKKRWKLAYIIWTMFVGCVFRLIFQMEDGMLISSFAINAIMSAAFIWKAKTLPLEGKIPIAVLKLVGSAAAWIFYLSDSVAVLIFGAVFVLLDLYYLCYCLEERNRARKPKRKR